MYPSTYSITRKWTPVCSSASKAVTMFGGHAMTAVTAITAQNTLGVAQVMAIPVGLVLSQIDAVLSDIGADAVKLGMIGSAETAQAVADRRKGANDHGG